MAQHKVTPLFISSEQGQLFAMYYPSSVENTSKCIVHVPAFAEEMNKSRHMVAMQSSAFTERGYSVLVLDLFGTGDSQGGFSEATWISWLQSIEAAFVWLDSQGVESISLWGVRSGVLLALDFLQQYTYPVEKLICWQPVLNGETFMMQFLRLRIASAMMDKDIPQEKTSDLRRQLQEGNCLEVAGYMLNPELVNPIMALKARKLNALNVKQCLVFELSAESEATISVACDQWVNLLKEQGCKVLAFTMQGSSFWAAQEMVNVPELIDLTALKVC